MGEKTGFSRCPPMAAGNEMQLLEQMKELKNHTDKELNVMLQELKKLRLDTHELIVRLSSLELGLEAIKNCAAGSLEPKSNGDDDKQALRTNGYVNWNSTHDFLKTKQWKRMSLLTEYLGRLERGGNPAYYDYITEYQTPFDEISRFPEDDLYINLGVPIVWAELLFIKNVVRHGDTIGITRKFLNLVNDYMHTRSSIEETYGLKWVDKPHSV